MNLGYTILGVLDPFEDRVPDGKTPGKDFGGGENTSGGKNIEDLINDATNPT